MSDKKLTREELSERLWGSGRSQRWDDLVDDVIKLTGYEPAPEEPERPEWWGEKLRPSRDAGAAFYEPRDGYCVSLGTPSTAHVKSNRRTLIASHNARLDAERELDELRAKLDRLVNGLAGLVEGQLPLNSAVAVAGVVVKTLADQPVLQSTNPGAHR